MLNRVMLLGKSQIQLFIISDKYREIRQKVLTDIDAGVTMVDIETGYGEQKQQGVLCVIHSRKLYSVKEAIQAVSYTHLYGKLLNTSIKNKSVY